jgi:hypothetical protein
MKIGDLVLLRPVKPGGGYYLRGDPGIVRATGPALVLAIDSLSGLQVLTNEQKQIWVGTNEVEVLNENR